MRLLAHLIGRVCFPLLTMFAAAGSAAANSGGATIDAVGVPPGFAELAQERDSLVDVYFGSHKIGEARVTARPGHVRFHDPRAVLSLVPNLEVSPELVSAFAAELPSHVNRICGEGETEECGTLSPERIGVIYNEALFRVDVFVSPALLRTIGSDEDVYLSAPEAPLSLTSSMGLTLSGSGEGSPAYNFQNRTIVGLRNARVRSDSSYASGYGLTFDTLVGEIDVPGFRYSAGLFWAPGADLTGHRRILGVGVGTQFDTRVDRDVIRGTPLVVFLAQPARVDILIDGRLVASRAYEAGNNVIDASTLPDGSYPLVLRITPASGPAREERRFFVKNAQIAPAGEPMYFGYVGLLANTRPGQPISVSKDLFYQLGTRRRLTRNVAVDLSLVGTSEKPMAEIGAWFMTSFARMRVAALASTSGDRGALLQIASGHSGPLNFNFDLRRVWSRDGNPLIPISSYVQTFDSAPLTADELGSGSYLQASGSVGYRLGAAYVAVIGSLRKDEGRPVDYAVGPSLSWPMISRNGVHVALQADAQFTRTSTAAYVGVRMFFDSAGYSLSSTAGRRGISGRAVGVPSRWRTVGDVTAHYSYQDAEQTRLSVSGGLNRDIDSTSARAQGALYTHFGSVRGEVSHDLGGAGRTLYGMTLQTGAIVSRDETMFGGRQLEESALVVSLEGSATGAEFDILVNEQPRGRVKAGSKLPVFLDPYRRYSVRLRPVAAAAVWFDAAKREVTLYPGNVAHVRWSVENLVTVFGRAIEPDGTPVQNAMIVSRRGVGQTDPEGFFQVDMTQGESLSFDAPGGRSCEISVSPSTSLQDYVSLGRVICQ